MWELYVHVYLCCRDWWYYKCTDMWSPHRLTNVFVIGNTLWVQQGWKQLWSSFPNWLPKSRSPKLRPFSKPTLLPVRRLENWRIGKHILIHPHVGVTHRALLVTSQGMDQCPVVGLCIALQPWLQGNYETLWSSGMFFPLCHVLYFSLPCSYSTPSASCRMAISSSK